MSDAPRITRPRLEVDRARRHPSGLFRSAGSAPGSDGERPSRASEAGGPRASDAIAHGVELGYRVIDEYVRQGSNLARGLSRGTFDPSSAPGDARQLGERMMQYATEAMSIWLELLGTATAGAGPLRGAAPPQSGPERSEAAPSDGGPRPAAPPPHDPAQALALSLDSRRPVEVAVRLHDPGSAHALRVHDLRAQPGEPRISDVRIETGGTGRPERLCIRIDDSLPPGTYNGLIIDDATGRPAGTLSVTVFEGRGK